MTDSHKWSTKEIACGQSTVLVCRVCGQSSLACALVCPGRWTGPCELELSRVESNPPGPADLVWIQTHSGKKFYPLRPVLGDVELIDIAHALSMKCRFSGHTREFYSVAQHSVLTSEIVPEKDALWALLHDAAEAYLADIARPIKPFLQGFQGIEDRLLYVILCRFGLESPMPESVKLADDILLTTERRDLMAATAHDWADCGVGLPRGTIIPLSPTEARQAFMARARELGKV